MLLETEIRFEAFGNGHLILQSGTSSAFDGEAQTRVLAEAFCGSQSPHLPGRFFG